MDPYGKLTYPCDTDIVSANHQTFGDSGVTERQRIPVAMQEIGSSKIHAMSLWHSSNGYPTTMASNGEYIIYTALAWRNEVVDIGSAFCMVEQLEDVSGLRGRESLPCL